MKKFFGKPRKYRVQGVSLFERCPVITELVILLTREYGLNASLAGIVGKVVGLNHDPAKPFLFGTESDEGEGREEGDEKLLCSACGRADSCEVFKLARADNVILFRKMEPGNIQPAFEKAGLI